MMVHLESIVLAILLNLILIQIVYGKLDYLDWNSQLANDITIDDEVYFKQTDNQRLSFTFPGTKWCGPGSKAANFDDLGKNKGADKCCRDHDHCDNIPAGDSKYNLTNNGMFTRLHCDCDQEFYDCLKTTRSRTANQVGFLYFSTINSYCYMEEHPVVGCRTWRRWFLRKRCVGYNFDTSKPKQWQWFDLPIWK